MDHWPWDKKQPNYSAGFGQKISFRWLQAGWDGRTDGGAGGLRGIGWLVAAAVLGNCILIGSWVSHPPGISPTKLCHQCTLYNCQPSVHAQRVKKSSWQGISRSAPHAIFSLASAVSANACLFVHWHGANYNIIISAKLPLCPHLLHCYSIATPCLIEGINLLPKLNLTISLLPQQPTFSGVLPSFSSWSQRAPVTYFHSALFQPAAVCRSANSKGLVFDRHLRNPLKSVSQNSIYVDRRDWPSLARWRNQSVLAGPPERWVRAQKGSSVALQGFPGLANSYTSTNSYIDTPGRTPSKNTTKQRAPEVRNTIFHRAPDKVAPYFQSDQSGWDLFGDDRSIFHFSIWSVGLGSIIFC